MLGRTKKFTGKEERKIEQVLPISEKPPELGRNQGDRRKTSKKRKTGKKRGDKK